MSYVNMDHAGWVERNANAAKSMDAASRKRMGTRAKRKDNTKGWLACPEKLSPFQASVMNILGMVFGGIYNAPIAWDSTQWEYGGGVSVVLRRTNPLSTFDWSNLTTFVFLCHEARIRGQVEPGGWNSFRLSFWKRDRAGSMSQRHPNLDEAVAKFREYLPADHSIIHRDASEDSHP
jgi:hypothetical protein